MKSMMFCRKCHATDDAIGQCGNTIIPCPEPERVDSSNVAVLTCGPCGKTLAVPVGEIMQGAVKSSGRCVSDLCRAVLVVEAPEPSVIKGPDLNAEPPKATTKAKAPK